MDIQKFVEEINANIKATSLTEETAKQILEHIKKAASAQKVKISYENPTIINRIRNYNEKLEKDQPAKLLRLKVVLSANKHKANFKNLFVRQCNGIVLVLQEKNNAVVCQLLAVPSHEFNPKFNQTVLLNHIVAGNYKIFQIQDGTVVNLYYDEKWVFSSKNSYDVNNLVWRGFHYKDILQDVLKQYPDFQFSKLDQNKTYTIGIKHPAHHPFNQPLEWTDDDFSENRAEWVRKAWFIQSYNLLTGEVLLSEEIGLPVQQPTELKQVPILFKRLDESLKDYVTRAKNERSAQFANKSEKETEKENPKSEKEKESEKENPKSEKEKEEDKLINFRKDMFLGIILRSTDPSKTNELSDILLESSLWKEIRNFVYQLPYIQNKVIREKQEQNFKNMNYVILSSYVNFSKKIPFITVFPQFKHYYDKYDKVIDIATEKIYEDMSNKTKKLKKKEEVEQQIVSVNTEDVIIDKIYNKFLDIVKNHYQLSEKNAKSEKNIKRFDPMRADKKNIRAIITNLRYLDILYHLI